MKLLLLSVACCVAMAGCSGGGANSNSISNGTNAASTNNNPAANAASTAGYPKSTADAFLKSCEDAGSERTFCTCVFDKVQAKYTFEEFAAIEAQLVDGEPPDEFLEFTGKAREECSKK